MKSQLIGKPPSESKIALLKHEIVKVLRANPGAHNVADISRSVIGNNIRDLVEFAKAIGRLEDDGKIVPATFGAKLFYKLASTADEAQGSTSRLAAGGVTCGSNIERTGEAVASIRHASELVTSQEGETALPVPAGNDFSILSRPHIIRKKEEVHVELCHECERMASGHCECGLPFCGNHSYPLDGNVRVCGVCYDTTKSEDMDLSAEMVRNITGRA